MTQSRKHLYFILLVVLLEVVGFGIVIPIYPKLLIELGAVSLSQAAIIGGYLIFVFAIMQFIFGPIMGGLSDRYGRRPVILISLVAISLDYLLLVYAPNLWWLVIGRIIGGVAGSTITAAHAYVTDISSKDNRAKYFGMLGAAIGTGFILGPALGGVLGEIDVRMPFKVAAIFVAITAVFGYFLLPESLAEDKRSKFDIKRANPLGTLRQMTKYKWVPILLAVMFFLEMAGQVYPSVWTFFTIERFSWTIKEVGYSLTAFGFLMAVVQGGLVAPISKAIGNKNTAYLGFFATTTTMFIVGFISQGWVLYAFLPLMAMGGLAGVGVRTILSLQVPDNAQGELQGAITSIVSIVAFISPLIMTQIFGYFTSKDAYVYLPGAPFIAAACFACIAATLFWLGSKASDKTKQVTETIMENG